MKEKGINERIKEIINWKEMKIKPEFHVNERGNIVIGFDEGEVAAMYMGALEFEIDNEVIKDIRK